MPRELADTLINNAMVVTMNPSRHVITDASVAIRDGRIIAVGKTSELSARFQAADVIDGRRFVVLKFRTTVHDPDKAYTQIWDWSARETRVGQFLRYTRFDGLPQLINVVRGETRLLDDWPD